MQASPQSSAWNPRCPAPILHRAAWVAAIAILSGAIGMASARPSRPTRPRSRPATTQPTQPAIPPPPTDREVALAVQRGLDYLYKAQKQDGKWDTKYEKQHPGGAEALVLLAALSAGEDSNSQPLRFALAALDAVRPQTTYARAVRAMAYARLGEKYAPRLAEDVDWLVKQQGVSGGWGYGPDHPTTRETPAWADSSNSQLAMLALRDGDDAGAPVPPAVWRKARMFWQKVQNSDGGWGYDMPGAGAGIMRIRPYSYGAMAAAGAASTFILLDKWAESLAPASRPTTTRASSPAFPPAGPPPDRENLERAAKWLEENYSLLRMPKQLWAENWLYYYHHCLARTADAGGWRTIAGHDWYAEMAAVLLARQRPDGSWPDPEGGAIDDASDRQDAPIRTCFAILALLEGAKGVLVNKLDVADPWETDCRDAAGLTGWLSRTVGRPLTWQRLPAAAPPRRFHEAPILYLRPAGNVTLGEELSGKIRTFLLEGGTVLIQADATDPNLSDQLQRYFLKLLPEYRAAKLAPDHPVYNLRFKIPPDSQPEGIGIGDYYRTRVFIVTSDLSGAWHRRADEAVPGAFHFGANLAQYATDEAGPAGRLASRHEPPAPTPPGKWLTVARIKHAGDWDTCPLAFPRLSNVLAAGLSIGVREADAQDLSKDPPADLALLWMTGSVPPKLGPAERQRLKAYLEAGGLLFADSAAGGEEFTGALLEMLNEMFGEGCVKPLPLDAALLTGAFDAGIGSDLRKVAYTRAVRARQVYPRGADLRFVQIDGRIAVVLTPYGVTCPMEGNPTYGCRGLSTDDARRLAANVVLYAAWRKGWTNGT